jgi:curli production assembly/transport component CsgF
MKKIVILLFFTVLASTGFSQDFVYTPTNPAFGGNTFNYQWLLNSAQAQNIYKADEDKYQKDPLEEFSESLNRQILSRLSREIIEKQFGEDGLEEGTYNVGDYQIEVGNNDAGVTVDIVDIKTGASTNVTVPYF